MSMSATRQSDRHRSAPRIDGVVWRCKTSVYAAPPRRESAGCRFDIHHLSQLNAAIVRRIGLNVLLGGKAITQIPIDRCQH